MQNIMSIKINIDGTIKRQCNMHPS